MTIAITTASASQPLNVLGEHLRPLTPAGLSIEVFETTGPEQVGPTSTGSPSTRQAAPALRQPAPSSTASLPRPPHRRHRAGYPAGWARRDGHRADPRTEAAMRTVVVGRIS
jgi:hypothetical protein